MSNPVGEAVSIDRFLELAEEELFCHWRMRWGSRAHRKARDAFIEALRISKLAWARVRPEDRKDCTPGFFPKYKGTRVRRK